MNGNRAIVSQCIPKAEPQENGMDFYGFSEENYNKIISSLNSISVSGINQIEAFHSAIEILTRPTRIVNVKAPHEEVNKHGEEIHKD